MMEKWDQRLKFFRYERGYGGHVSDTDRLTLKLSFYGQDDLLMIFDNLEIVYERYESQPPQPESGKPYTSAEISNFPFLVPETQWIRQPATNQFRTLYGNRLRRSMRSGQSCIKIPRFRTRRVYEMNCLSPCRKAGLPHDVRQFHLGQGGLCVGPMTPFTRSAL